MPISSKELPKLQFRADNREFLKKLENDDPELKSIYIQRPLDEPSDSEEEINEDENLENDSDTDSTQEEAEFIPELVVALCKNKHVQTLVLDAQVFEYDFQSKPFIEKYLKNNNHLKKLVWSNDTGIYPLALFNVLGSNKTLIELDISKPTFFQQSVVDIRKPKVIHLPQIDALVNNTTLKILKLDSINITEKLPGFRRFCEAIGKNKGIEELYFRGYKLDNSALTNIGNMLENNKHLTTLNFSNISTSVNGLLILGKSLGKNTSLKEISLDFIFQDKLIEGKITKDQISEEQLFLFLTDLNKNKSIHSINLGQSIKDNLKTLRIQNALLDLSANLKKVTIDGKPFEPSFSDQMKLNKR